MRFEAEVKVQNSAHSLILEPLTGCFSQKYSVHFCVLFAFTLPPSKRPTMTSHCEKIESIDFAASKPDEIRAWISKVEEEDRKRRTTRPLPTRDIHGGRHRQDEEELQEVPPSDPKEPLRHPWPKEIVAALREGKVHFPPPADIDLTLEEYATVLCRLLDLPIGDDLVTSVHSLMLYFLDLGPEGADGAQADRSLL